MKRERWLSFPVSAVISFAVSFAGAMCLQSAFSLEANWVHVILGCAGASLLFSLGFALKWWYLSLIPVLAASGWLWYKGALGRAIELLVYRISSTYNSAYDSGVLYWSETAPEAGGCTLALCLIGCLVAFVCAWVICRRKTALPAVLLAVLPLAACFVVTDTVPASGYLYLLVLGITVLLLTQLTRRKNSLKGNLLTLLVAVPVALAVAILFWAVPRDTYQGQDRAEKILETVQSWVENMGEQGPTGTSTAVQESVALDKKGRLVQTHTPVMTVGMENPTSAPDRTVTLYLRQQGFQMYDGTSWYNENGNDIYQWIQWNYMSGYSEATIVTRNQHLMQFVPYYAQYRRTTAEGDIYKQDVSVDQLGITENLGQEYSYTFYLYQLSPDAPSATINQQTGGLRLPVGTYTPDAISLPASTVTWAETVVYPLVEGKTTVMEQAEAIGAYVRDLAQYDRNTARMPDDQTDFARWFATEAESGYCVHYATTAAVLLRAAGIHAQYVEGYVARVTEDGTATTVYEDQAHAWVEYYDPAVGWRILECTPAEGVPNYISGPQGQHQNDPQAPLTPPEQNAPQQIPQQEQPKTVWRGWLWVAGVLAAALVIVLQWQLRLRILRRRLTGGSANQQAVQLWREVVRLSRFCKYRPKPELYALAQKAKFSQHTLCPDEVEQLQAALAECRRKLKARPWYWQPIYTLFLAVY